MFRLWAVFAHLYSLEGLIQVLNNQVMAGVSGLCCTKTRLKVLVCVLGSYSGGQQGNACEMTQQCCGFQQKGCCINDQKCYVVNERVCMTTDTPNCAIKNKEQ